MTLMSARNRRVTPFGDGFRYDEPHTMDTALVDAHARADNRLAQESMQDTTRMLQECAEFLRRPGSAIGGMPDAGLSKVAESLPRAFSPVQQYKPHILPIAATPYAGSNLNFLRTFDHGSERAVVDAVYQGSGRQAPGIVGQYSAVDLSNGEMAAALLVGDNPVNSYRYLPGGSTKVMNVLEATSQKALMENWIHPGEYAPSYDIGAVATIALPSHARAWAEPTSDGQFGGLVTVIGDASFDLYASLGDGKELHQRRTIRFLRASASTFGRSGEVAFNAPVSIGVELSAPAGAVLIVMRVTLTLWTIRALTAEGTSPSGGLVGAVLADHEVDPPNGLISVPHPGRAKVLLSSVVCRG